MRDVLGGHFPVVETVGRVGRYDSSTNNQSLKKSMTQWESCSRAQEKSVNATNEGCGSC
jgi:hypothetical protein